MEQKLTPQEKWEQAGLENNFIFYKIMSTHPEICRQLLEIVLNMKIDHVEIKTEELLDYDFESKAVRLDVYAVGEEKAFDLEIQTTNPGNLPKRARYYQSVMDLSQLKKGMNYSKLYTNYVIFICTKDIFNLGLPVYTFENICRENTELSLGDATMKIFINCTCYDKMSESELKNFSRFVMKKDANSSFTKSLQALVADTKHNSQWRHQYMTLEMYLEDKFEEGKQIGENNMAIQTAKKALSMNLSFDDIMKLTNLSLQKVTELANELQLQN